MSQPDIALIRLASQKLTGMKIKSPKEIVTWMGAMQAQDYPMAKWAIGVRIPDATDQSVETAITNAEIIRTHILRPTWHFVAAEDIYWMLDLCAAQLKARQNSRDRQLGLTEATYNKSNHTIEKVLRKGEHLIREELIAELNKAGIATDENRAAHLFMRAEIEKIICSGATRNGKTSYALLAERVPKARLLSREEAVAELARRYFTSRCPARLQDFTWWSGLPANDAKLGLEMVKSAFVPEVIDGSTYWLSADITAPQVSQPLAYLLPTYDELIISYTDRNASIPSDLEQHMKKISDRGVFRPIIVVNGQVVGIWKRTTQKDKMLMEIQPFTATDQPIMELIIQAANQYGRFSGKKIEVLLDNIK